MKISNKKAIISGEMIMVFPKILFLIAVLFAFVILIKSLIITQIDVTPTEAAVMTNRILFTQDGISLYDEDIDRLYPGVIDLDRFNEIRISGQVSDPFNDLDNMVMRYGDDKEGNPYNPIIAAKITLKQEPEDDIVIYYNKKWYDRWEPKVIPGIKGGPGSVKEINKEVYVLVDDDGVKTPGILEFHILG